MDSDVATARGVKPRARIAYQTMVGTDPYYLLDGPVYATQKMLDQSPFLDLRISICSGMQRSLRRPSPCRGSRCDNVPGGPDQCQRRGHRPRPSRRLQRQPPHHDGAPRARAHRRPLGPRHHVPGRAPSGSPPSWSDSPDLAPRQARRSAGEPDRQGLQAVVEVGADPAGLAGQLDPGERGQQSPSKKTLPFQVGRGAPQRQKCSAIPNDRCGFGILRWMSKALGESANTSSSRLADE